jgi:hypothetical protein
MKLLFYSKEKREKWEGEEKSPSEPHCRSATNTHLTTGKIVVSCS